MHETNVLLISYDYSVFTLAPVARSSKENYITIPINENLTVGKVSHNFLERFARSRVFNKSLQGAT